MKRIIIAVAGLFIVGLTACSAKIGIPIPKDDGGARTHPSGPMIIIESQPKPKVEPRSN